METRAASVDSLEPRPHTPVPIGSYVPLVALTCDAVSERRASSPIDERTVGVKVMEDSNAKVPAYWFRIPGGGGRGLAFTEAFKKKHGITPQRCFKILLLNEMLWISSGTLGMLAGIEYARYYVSNDLNWLNRIDTICFTPLALTRAFFYPWFGGMMDRLARKHVLVPANMANCTQAVLMACVPCVPVLFICRLLGVVGGVQGMGTFAMMRDLFPVHVWEQEEGGYTHVLSQVALVGAIVVGATGLIGLCLLQVIQNEYQLRKDLCGKKHCVPDGQFSWHGAWGIDGCLRVIALLSASLAFCATCVMIFFVPETLPQDFADARDLSTYAKEKWKELGKPWRALNVFCTRQLRFLLLADFAVMVGWAGGPSSFLSWYRVVEDDVSNFDMALLAGATAVGALAIYIVVGKVTIRIGDLRGVWIPSAALLACFAFYTTALASTPWPLMFPGMLFLNGPGMAMTSCKDGLYSKLFPPDMQATWRMGKSFLNNVQSSAFRWLFVLMFEISEDWRHPWNMICVALSGCLVATSCGILIYIAKNMDPKEAIDNGHALDAFYQTNFWKGVSLRRSQAKLEKKADEAGKKQHWEVPWNQLSDGMDRSIEVAGTQDIHENAAAKLEDTVEKEQQTACNASETVIPSCVGNASATTSAID